MIRVSCVLVAFLVAPLAAQCSPGWQAVGQVPGVQGMQPMVRTMVTWDPDGVGPLTALIVAGGSFVVQAGGVTCSSIAAFDPTTNTWLPLGSGMTNGGALATVNALLVLPNGDLLASGIFSAAGGVAAASIARWSGASWQPLGAGLGGTVDALALLANGHVVAGGLFILPGNTQASYVARWDGAAWQPLGSATAPGSAAVRCLAVQPNGDLIAGVENIFVNTQFFWRWDGAAWQPHGPSWPSSPFTAGNALLSLPNGELVATGPYSGWPPLYGVARWTGTSWQTLGTMNGPPRALLGLPNGEFLVGGSFSTAGGTAANNLARWNGASWQPIGGGTDGIVGALAMLQNGDVFLGGSFITQAGGQAVSNFARLVPACAATAAVLPTSCLGPAGPMIATADTLPWVGATCATHATGFVATAFAFAVLGLTSPNTLLVTLHPAGNPNCHVLASHDAVRFLPQSGGTVRYQFAVPNSLAFVGVLLFEQFVQLDIGALGAITSLSSSNGLALTIGAL